MGAAKIILAELPEWAKTIPYQVKKIAVEDAYKAFSNGVRKWKKQGEPFKLKFRSRKNPKQSCFVPASALRDAGIYPRIALQRAESYPANQKDARLICEQGRWYVYVYVPYQVAIAKTENQSRTVALDSYFFNRLCRRPSV